jgi:hypothetical protein
LAGGFDRVDHSLIGPGGNDHRDKRQLVVHGGRLRLGVQSSSGNWAPGADYRDRNGPQKRRDLYPGRDNK